MQGQDLQRLKGKGILTTCCCTALLGGLSSSYGQAIIETNPHGRDVLVLPTFHTEEEAIVEERGDNVLRYGPWSIFPRVRASQIRPVKRFATFFPMRPVCCFRLVSES